MKSSGFTLLELLIAIVILGILSAIALPAFLRQANRAKEAEAKVTIGVINRAQQIYFLENSKFGSLANLDVNISNTGNYIYASSPNTTGTDLFALTTAQPTEPNIRGFAGKVWITSDSSRRTVSQSILCEGRFGEVPTIRGITCP